LVLFDLGISSYHFEESERGFSFLKDERLDMRLDTTARRSAFDVVNRYPEEQLADVIWKYGEERYSRRIAKAIVQTRRRGDIQSSSELAKIIYAAVPPAYRYGRIHPATRTFQAVRIEVNGELDRITPALRGAVDALQSGDQFPFAGRPACQMAVQGTCRRGRACGAHPYKEARGAGGRRGAGERAVSECQTPCRGKTLGGWHELAD
jgi:hypothetical protein